MDDAPAAARIEMIGAVLERVAHDDDHRLSDPPRAVAAAALEDVWFTYFVCFVLWVGCARCGWFRG
ncbi:hypothetical protein [Catenuloplanes atrovinosus]|uniref:hypothetical protein n=1 Tax=Catenuloplanes atrovinosus TaxID=137266 RepID=UPI0035B5327D